MCSYSYHDHSLPPASTISTLATRVSRNLNEIIPMLSKKIRYRRTVPLSIISCIACWIFAIGVIIDLTCFLWKSVFVDVVLMSKVRPIAICAGINSSGYRYSGNLVLPVRNASNVLEAWFIGGVEIGKIYLSYARRCKGVMSGIRIKMLTRWSDSRGKHR
jgi:hypothetical protein